MRGDTRPGNIELAATNRLVAVVANGIFCCFAAASIHRLDRDGDIHRHKSESIQVRGEVILMSTHPPEGMTLEKYVEQGIEAIFKNVAEIYGNSPTTTPEETGGAAWMIFKAQMTLVTAWRNFCESEGKHV